MLLQPITVPFSKSTLKPSVYTLTFDKPCSAVEMEETCSVISPSKDAIECPLPVH